MAGSNNSKLPQRIGRYEILAQLGVGGMGVVYLGEHKSERVAIKCIHSGLAADDEFRVRFRREIDACKKVSGLCCAQYFDSDPNADIPWLAVEYIPGPNLAQAVQSQGGLPKQSAFGVSVGIAEGLAAIHRAGLVHRDLKPSNVILGPDGPRIIDFGVVKDGEATSFTRTNATVGSPGWMAPEQIRSDEISPATDVFTWALLTAYAYQGTSPFGTGPHEALMLRILNEDPDLSGLPPSLAALCASALSKDPSARPTIYEILGQLIPGVPMTQVQTGLDDPVTEIMQKTWVASVSNQGAVQPRVTKKSHKRGSIVAFAVVSAILVAGIGVAVLQLRNTNSSQLADTESELSTPDDTPSTVAIQTSSTTTAKATLDLDAARADWKVASAALPTCRLNSEVTAISGKATAVSGDGVDCGLNGLESVYLWEYGTTGWKQMASQPIGIPITGYKFQDLTDDGVPDIWVTAAARNEVSFVMSNGPDAGYWRLIEFEGAEGVQNMVLDSSGALTSSVLTCVPSCVAGGTTTTYWKYDPKSLMVGQFVAE
jgi:serine/threonine protein kinase